MNLLYLFLVILAAMALVGILLYLRLRRKLNQLRGPESGIPERETPQSTYFDYEMTATDQFLYDRCCRYMTERKPFLVESFSLQDLANVMHTNRAYLSKAINRYSGKNFRQYVNYYRIMYCMDLFKENMSLRITDLAQLSGFHTVTSFYKSFKAVMGEPPSHWCMRLRRKHRQNMKR